MLQATPDAVLLPTLLCMNFGLQVSQRNKTMVPSDPSLAATFVVAFA